MTGPYAPHLLHQNSFTVGIGVTNLNFGLMAMLLGIKVKFLGGIFNFVDNSRPFLDEEATRVTS